MSAALFESVARIARHEAAARMVAAVGTVTEIFPADPAQPDHAVSVELRDAGLILPRVPIAVGALGFCAIPKVGDLVVLVFLDGDANAPVVVGRLYHPKLDPPEHAADQLVLALPPGAASPKLTVKVSGPDGTFELAIPGAGGADVQLTCTPDKAELTVGAMRATLSSAGGGSVEVAAGSTALKLKQDGDITISTPGKFKLDATEVEIAGSAKVKISAAGVDIN